MNKNTNFVFHEVFSCVVCLTLLSGVVSMYLSSRPKLSPEETRIFEMALNTYQTGVGAVFGLLGAKATNSTK